jgi:glucose-6-phosphate 1-dehydrogenase
MRVTTLYDKPYGSDQGNFGQMNSKLEEHTTPHYLDHYLLKQMLSKIEEFLNEK